MEWQRFWRHIRMTRWQAARMFPPRSLDAIEAAIRAGETHHRGEVRFIVEAELATDDLLRGISTRQRAGVLFARERVWDTEANTGVLIYVALADRKVEIIADRGIAARVAEDEWRRIVRGMEAAYREGHFEAGSIAALEAVNALLTQHFPRVLAKHNELPDRPLVI